MLSCIQLTCIISTAPGVPVIINTVAAVNEITLSWSSAGPSVSYQVEWRSGPVEDSAQVSDGSTSYTISGLEAESTYTVSVTAENEAGLRSESEAILVNTGKRIIIKIDP